jgi:hypothetical protein
MGVKVLEVVPANIIPSKFLCKYILPLTMFREVLCVLTKSARLASKRLYMTLRGWLFHPMEINVVVLFRILRLVSR